MKAKLFGAFALIAALVFAGCEPTESSKGNGTGDESVTAIILPESITLPEGESYRLPIEFEPASANPKVTWTSSNEAVASVNEFGLVTANVKGEAIITAAVGDVKDECTVSVKPYAESINYSSAILFDTDTTFLLDTVTGVIPVFPIKASDGTTYNCYLALAQLYIMSEGFYFNESGYMDGTIHGSWMSVQAPMYYAPGYMNGSDRGTVFSLGEWAVFQPEKDTLLANVAQPGFVSKEAYLYYADLFVQYYNMALEATTEEEADQLLGAAYTGIQYAGLCVGGTYVEEFEYHSTEEGYQENGYYGSYVPAGVITDAYFSLNTNGINELMYGLDFLQATYVPIADDATYTWGCNWDVNDSTGVISWVDQDIHYGEPITYTYGEVPAGAPAKMVARPTPIKEMVPMQKMQIKNKFNLERNNYSFIKK